MDLCSLPVSLLAWGDPGLRLYSRVNGELEEGLCPRGTSQDCCCQNPHPHGKPLLTHTSFPLWFIIGYWIQSPVLYNRTLLFVHPIYKSSHLLLPNLSSLHPCPPGKVCSLCLWICFFFVARFICTIFSITHISEYMSFYFWLASLSMIKSSCINAAVNDIISFLLMAG